MNKMPGTDRLDPVSGENIADYMTPDGQLVPMKDSDYAKLQAMAAPQTPMAPAAPTPPPFVPKTETEQLFSKTYTPKPETAPISPAQSAALSPPTPEETAALKTALAKPAPAAPTPAPAPTQDTVPAPVPAANPLSMSVTEPVNVGLGFREPAELKKLAQLQIKQGEIQAQQELIKRDSLIKENELLAQQYEDRMIAKAAEEERRKALEQRMDSAIRKYENMEIDTGRLWGAKSTGDKIMSAIALAMGAYVQGAGATDTNPALVNLQRAVDEDIKIQEANINRAGAVADKYRGMYSDLLNEFKDADLARAATHKFALDKMTSYYNALAANHSSDLVKNAAQQLAQTSMQKAAAVEDTIMLKKLELAGKQSALPPGLKAFDEKTAADMLQWQADREQAKETLRILSKTRGRLEKAAGDSVDWVSGRVVGRLPEFLRSEESLKIQQDMRRTAMSQLRQLLGPQFTFMENQMVQELSYDPKLSAEANLEKLAGAMSVLERTYRANETRYNDFIKTGTTRGTVIPAEVNAKSYGK